MENLEIKVREQLIEVLKKDYDKCLKLADAYFKGDIEKTIKTAKKMHKMTLNEVMYLLDNAGIPLITTFADIESEPNREYHILIERGILPKEKVCYVVRYNPKGEEVYVKYEDLDSKSLENIIYYTKDVIYKKYHKLYAEDLYNGRQDVYLKIIIKEREEVHSRLYRLLKLIELHKENIEYITVLESQKDILKMFISMLTERIKWLQK